MSTTRFNAQTKLAPEVWNYLYVLLGFVLAIAGDIIQMLELDSTYSLVTYAIVIGIASWLILFNRQVQLTLNWLRTKHEQVWR